MLHLYPLEPLSAPIGSFTLFLLIPTVRFCSQSRWRCSVLSSGAADIVVPVYDLSLVLLVDHSQVIYSP
jgi:hypothetical protein